MIEKSRMFNYFKQYLLEKVSQTIYVNGRFSNSVMMDLNQLWIHFITVFRGCHLFKPCYLGWRMGFGLKIKRRNYGKNFFVTFFNTWPKKIIVCKMHLKLVMQFVLLKAPFFSLLLAFTLWQLPNIKSSI